MCNLAKMKIWCVGNLMPKDSWIIRTVVDNLSFSTKIRLWSSTELWLLCQFLTLLDIVSRATVVAHSSACHPYIVRQSINPGFWEFSVYRCFWEISGLGHSGVIRCISDLREACISITAGCRAKRIKIWASGWVFSVYRILVKLKCFR